MYVIETQDASGKWNIVATLDNALTALRHAEALADSGTNTRIRMADNLELMWGPSDEFTEVDVN